MSHRLTTIGRHHGMEVGDYIQIGGHRFKVESVATTNFYVRPLRWHEAIRYHLCRFFRAVWRLVRLRKRGA